MEAAANSYADLVELIPVDDEPLSAEELRRASLGTEGGVRAVGLLTYLAAFLYLVVGVAVYAAMFQPSAWLEEEVRPTAAIIGLGVISALFLSLSYLSWRAARGLRSLRTDYSWVVVLTSLVQLFNLPIGTLVAIAVLWTVFSKQGRYVRSAEYRDIVARTPELAYRPAYGKLAAAALAIAIAFVATLTLLTS